MEEKEFIDWCYDMHLQNTNGRETEDEMFRLGIEAAYQEREHLNKPKEEGCVHNYKIMGHQLNGHYECIACGHQKDL